MMQAMFMAIYTSSPIDTGLVLRHKTLMLKEQDYDDWLECFDASCKQVRIRDKTFKDSMNDVVHKMKQSLAIEKHFDNIFDKLIPTDQTELVNELQALHKLVQSRD